MKPLIATEVNPSPAVHETDITNLGALEKLETVRVCSHVSNGRVEIVSSTLTCFPVLFEGMQGRVYTIQ